MAGAHEKKNRLLMFFFFVFFSWPPNCRNQQLLVECSHIDELANNSYSTDTSTESDQQDEDNSRTQLHVKPLPVAKNITETDPNSHQNSWCVLQ